MKYMLDIVLIVGLLWIGYLWNGEKQRGLGLDDEIEKFKANVARLELDLSQAKDTGAKAAAELESTKALLEQSSKDLLAQTDALNAKSAEGEKLRTDLVAAVARVKELEGYKAKAIVAEMPKPAQP
ncbi:MAG: hypothetical protein EOM72_01545 [Opitutae bacterium]|nr:hypothetical protein [Opitutae bacterium]